MAEFIRRAQRPDGSGRLARRAQRVGGQAADALERITRPARNVGFPYRRPTVPRGVSVPEEASGLGAHYDTDWARRPAATVARSAIVAGPLRLATQVVTSPEILGRDRLADLADLEEPPPLIFAPTHHSHLDTGLVISAVPRPWRHDLVVAAAADYFFDKQWKATLSALALNAIPIDREAAGRRSADLARELIEDGYSLVIYPEGGRSPDGWGQEFRGGAAYLSARTGAPVVPIFIDGTGAIFGKGMKRPRLGRAKVVFGAPLLPDPDESTRRFNARIERAVTVLGDEATTDYWTSLRRDAEGASPQLTGPDYTGWRRDWMLSEQRRRRTTGIRPTRTRRWPDLG